MSVLNVAYRQVEVSATGPSLAQRSPTECSASNERDLKTSGMRRRRSITALLRLKKKYKANIFSAS